MNPFEISGGCVEILSLPFRRPFITASGRKTLTRNAALTMDLRGGSRGYGEASTSLAMKSHSASGLAAALRGLLRRFLGKDVRRLRALTQEAWSASPYPEAAAAFECALTEALLNELRVPPVEWFGGALSKLETDLTLPAAAPEEAAAAAAEAAALGFRVFKVKVGAGSPREDLARVIAVDRAAGRPSLLLDGNQGMTTRSALGLLESCAKRGLRVKLLEQPLPKDSLKEMAALRKRSPVPIAADESVRSEEDAWRVISADAADVINIKVAKTGLESSRAILALARSAGVRLMIGCMEESARGLAASVHLALGTGAFSFADLDSDCLLAPGQPPETFRRKGPWLYAL